MCSAVSLGKKQIKERTVGLSVTKNGDLVRFVGERVNAVERVFGNIMVAKKMKVVCGVMNACDKIVKYVKILISLSAVSE